MGERLALASALGRRLTMVCDISNALADGPRVMLLILIWGDPIASKFNELCVCMSLLMQSRNCVRILYLSSFVFLYDIKNLLGD